jgi:quercetin 2,3-dioxygenase
MHSEFNPSAKDPVRLLQIWIMPERKGLKPAYEQFKYDDADLRNQLALVAGPEATVTIRQDVNLYITRLDAGKEVKHALESGRHAWVQIARGAVLVNGKELKAGDGAAISDEPEVHIEAVKPSEVLLFDLA